MFNIQIIKYFAYVYCIVFYLINEPINIYYFNFFYCVIKINPSTLKNILISVFFNVKIDRNSLIDLINVYNTN